LGAFQHYIMDGRPSFPLLYLPGTYLGCTPEARMLLLAANTLGLLQSSTNRCSAVASHTCRVFCGYSPIYTRQHLEAEHALVRVRYTECISLTRKNRLASNKCCSISWVSRWNEGYFRSLYLVMEDTWLLSRGLREIFMDTLLRHRFASL